MSRIKRLPDKVDAHMEIEVDGELMRRTRTFVWNGEGVNAVVPDDLVEGKGALNRVYG